MIFMSFWRIKKKRGRDYWEWKKAKGIRREKKDITWARGKRKNKEGKGAAHKTNKPDQE